MIALYSFIALCITGSCLSLNLPYTGCCNSSNGSACFNNGCFCDANCYFFGDCCDDIEDIGCAIESSLSIRTKSLDLSLSSITTTSEQPSASTIIKTSVMDSSSTNIPSTSKSFSPLSTPAVVVENALKASILGINEDTVSISIE